MRTSLNRLINTSVKVMLTDSNHLDAVLKEVHEQHIVLTQTVEKVTILVVVPFSSILVVFEMPPEGKPIRA